MVDASSIFALGALLFLKHFVADGPLQTSWQVRNKGIFGHPAGIAHAGTHVLGSAAAFALWPHVFGPSMEELQAHLPFLGALLAAEFVIHYFVDLAKCRLDAIFKCSERGSGRKGDPILHIRSVLFFHLFLADQTCHSLTYVAMLAIIIGRGVA